MKDNVLRELSRDPCLLSEELRALSAGQLEVIAGPLFKEWQAIGKQEEWAARWWSRNKHRFVEKPSGFFGLQRQ